jgi:hypothetical protein
LKCLAGTLFLLYYGRGQHKPYAMFTLLQKKELNLFLCSDAIINHMNLQLEKKMQWLNPKPTDM